jgi:hypothetical protein
MSVAWQFTTWNDAKEKPFPRDGMIWFDVGFGHHPTAVSRIEPLSCRTLCIFHNLLKISRFYISNLNTVVAPSLSEDMCNRQ